MRIILMLLCALGLSACATTSGSYAPQSGYSVDTDIQELREQFGIATSLKSYYSTGETDLRRNEFIAGRLALYDLEYLRFAQSLRLGRADADMLFDTSLIGLGLATTLAAGERTKTVLGAITTALTGERSSFEKNYYADKTSNALVTQMNAERKKALLPILKGTLQPVSAYPMTSAIRDLSAYQFAGTMDGALQGVQLDAAAKDAEFSDRIAQYRSYAYDPDEVSDKILDWLYPGVVSYDDNGAALNAQNVVIPMNQTNAGLLTQEIQKLGYDGLTIDAFLNAGGLADDRRKAATELKIP